MQQLTYEQAKELILAAVGPFSFEITTGERFTIESTRDLQTIKRQMRAERAIIWRQCGRGVQRSA